MKKVSIIIPVYNSSKYLKQCIDSVINQTYKNLEIIIIDDNSSDNSTEIINKIKDNRIKLVSNKKNKGVANTRNIGIKKATGSYICFLDSDDYWHNDKIKKQVDFIEKNNYTFIYSSYIYLRGNDKHIAKVPKKLTYKKALKNTAIFTSTVMFNMEHLNKKDIMMPIIRMGQDTATWWQILKKGIVAYAIDEPLVIYRVGNKSLSSNKIKALKRTWKLYLREDINLFMKIYCFICYLFNAIKRRIV